VGNTFEKEFNGGERHTIKTYRDQVDDSQPQQRISVDIYPLATHNKPQRLAVDSHEANQLHKIARSQCKALAEFIQAGQHSAGAGRRRCWPRLNTGRMAVPSAYWVTSVMYSGWP